LNLQTYCKIKEAKSIKELEEMKEDGWELIETYNLFTTCDNMIYVMGLSYLVEIEKQNKIFTELVTEFASKENIIYFYYKKITGNIEDFCEGLEIARANNFLEEDCIFPNFDIENKKQLLKIYKELDTALSFVKTENKVKIAIKKENSEGQKNK
jgi:hypothetical protein